MTKLLIYMTNVYMTNIDMMFSLNHMTLICITFHILTKYESWLWCKIVQNIARCTIVQLALCKLVPANARYCKVVQGSVE